MTFLLGVFGCGGDSTSESTHLVKEPTEAVLAADPEASQAIQSALSDTINEASIRYAPLSYSYNEDLLTMLDQIETKLAGKADASTPRLLPKLSEEEELAHFRETTQRWEAQTKKSLRDTIDPLKADVAARKPGATFHPEFQKKFSEEFDDFIKIEVVEMRERRNRAIHEAAEALFAPYRTTHPELVKHFEKTLNAPPYALANAADALATEPAEEATKPPET